MILTTSVLPTKYFETIHCIGDIGRSTISRSSAQTSKRQRSDDVTISDRVVDDIFGDDKMENILASKPSS